MMVKIGVRLLVVVVLIMQTLAAATNPLQAAQSARANQHGVSRNGSA